MNDDRATSKDRATSVEDVRVLARIANLPLDESRYEPIANLLSDWIPDATALSHKMASEEFCQVVPITVLTFRDATEGTE